MPSTAARGCRSLGTGTQGLSPGQNCPGGSRTKSGEREPQLPPRQTPTHLPMHPTNTPHSFPETHPPFQSSTPTVIPMLLPSPHPAATTSTPHLPTSNSCPPGACRHPLLPQGSARAGELRGAAPPASQVARKRPSPSADGGSRGIIQPSTENLPDPTIGPPAATQALGKPATG